jgi:hypothetical protein
VQTSAYEIQREKNIAVNKQKLATLGLGIEATADGEAMAGEKKRKRQAAPQQQEQERHALTHSQ